MEWEFVPDIENNVIKGGKWVPVDEAKWVLDHPEVHTSIAEYRRLLAEAIESKPCQCQKEHKPQGSGLLDSAILRLGYRFRFEPAPNFPLSQSSEPGAEPQRLIEHLHRRHRQHPFPESPRPPIEGSCLTDSDLRPD